MFSHYAFLKHMHDGRVCNYTASPLKKRGKQLKCVQLESTSHGESVAPDKDDWQLPELFYIIIPGIIGMFIL